MATADTQRGSILEGALWMIGLSIVLFWLPVLGGLIAGFVGGRRSGGIGQALIASIIPALLAGTLLMLIGTTFGLPIIGAVAGGGVFVVMLVSAVPTMLAAIVGAATV